ncbi:MAG: error-prone DNA polymerase [Thermodesulfobacteriota bacterium]
MGGPWYVPLWAKSHYSFLEGASSPGELVEEARRLGLEAMALTDRDGLYGIVRGHVAAREAGLRLIVGAQVSLEEGGQVVLLAQDRLGYAHLCELITKGRLRSPKGGCQLRWEEVCEHAQGLIALVGGQESLLAQEADPDPVLGILKEAFGDRLYGLLARHKRAEERRWELRVLQRARRHSIPLVASNEVLYHAPSRRRLQDVLTCIRHKVTLSTAGRLTRPNSEHALLSPFAFQALFQDLPDAVARTGEVAQRCTFSLSELRYTYPSERLPDGLTSMDWLRELTFQGAMERYGGEIPEEVREQLEKELTLIQELDYSGYFLTMWEIVKFCKERSILCQGRGSAANSAVCYSLGITAVDPVRMGLLFERFISKERAEPPDIDLDIMHKRREEVIQHVYERYGRQRAAMVANFIRYRPKMAVRDVGKALGLPQTSLDRLAKLLPYHGEVTAEHLRMAGMDPELPAHQHLLTLCAEILDVPRHLSIHPGGFLLGHQPVSQIVPIENASMEGRTVIQWDKEDIEDLGLFKVDLLGLGALTQLDLCLRLLEDHHGVKLSMATIPTEDPQTYEMISKGDTIGVFQLESRAQMSMLPRLKPRSFYDLVIEISIIRPGPITGGMVHPYLRRRNGEEPVDYPHESLRPVLEKTLGVPIFQEQVMRLAMVAADYSPGEADQLRRDMAAWRRGGRIGRHRERLISRMIAKGIPLEFAERVFQQIQGFGEYGFPESHAASFALVSYAAAWLKCHWPAEFTCSLLNAQPMGFYSTATIIEDAKRHGVEVRPASVVHSQWDCTMEPVREETREGASMDAPIPMAVRMGLRFIKGLGMGDWERIRKARESSPFVSLEDFAGRCGLDKGVLSRLAQAGALEPLVRGRRDALWKVLGIAGRPKTPLPIMEMERPVRFDSLTDYQTVLWDYRTQQHSPMAHPLATVRKRLREMGSPTAREISAMPHGRAVKYAGLVICRQRPGTAKGVTFLTLEDETGFVNVVVWPQLYARYMSLIKTAPLLGVSGKLQVHGEVVHLVAQRVWLPDLPLGQARARSRDFH